MMIPTQPVLWPHENLRAPGLLCKMLVQMSGAPGSGKSTLANLLAKATDGVVINHDIIKSFLLENGNPFDQSAKLTYCFQWILAEDLIQQGRTVIMDSTCNYPETLHAGTSLAQQHGYEYRYVECQVHDIEVLEKRLQSRVALRSQRKGVNDSPPDAHTANPDDNRELFRKWIENPCRPASDVITVDPTKTPEKCLNYVLEEFARIAHQSGETTSNGLPTSRALPAANGRPTDDTLAALLPADDGVPAVLGAAPTCSPTNPVPQIFPSGYGYVGDYDAVASILLNELPFKSTRLSSLQRFVFKGIGVQTSHRSDLQRRVSEFLSLDNSTTSVICLTSGTNALRAALKSVVADGRSETRNEIIVPALTAVSTAEAVMMEGFVPVIVDVDPITWILSPQATAQAISEKTAVIVTVDWLGTLCDLRPFRTLADKHGLKLISDSAQSFGARPGRPSSVELADATIFSTGFPKVLHTGGSGGILVCSTSQAEWLEQEPSGILRHEAMFEMNAYLGLRALDRLPQDLKTRADAAEAYRTLLRNTPGITFQHIAPGSGTNHYQLSVTIDTKSFGLDARTLCWALQAENVLCSSERMRCLGNMSRLLRRSRVAGGLPISRMISDNSLTFPIFNHLTLELCQRICSCIETIHKHAESIATMKDAIVAPLPRSSRQHAEINDIVDKLRDYWILPIFEQKGFASGIDGGTSWTVLVRGTHLAERQISIDEVHRQILSRSKWSQGDVVIDGLVVHAQVGTTGLILAQSSQENSTVTNKPFYLDESGSSASVVLVLGRNGQAEVHKLCSEEGIDGNGRPWLEEQVRFFEASVAVRETTLFVKPLRHSLVESTMSVAFPYVPSHTLAEMAFAGMGADSLLAVVDDLLGSMVDAVWCKGTISGFDQYIEQAHFSRMRRRVTIARAAVSELDDIANQDWITLNGRRLLGFNHVLEALSCHPDIKNIVPQMLGEIHGDLNLHNILCQLDPNADRPVVLIDPRGVPLLHDYPGAQALEPGDYAYDISKLKFSLSGFSEIRKGFYSLRGEGRTFELLFKEHTGSDTLRIADRRLFATLSSNKDFVKWIDAVEPSGVHSFELRVLLGEAAHFVADSACALGRDKNEEVLPLFLMGLAKLNDVLDRVEGRSDPSTNGLKGSVEMEDASESPSYGAAKIRSALLESPQVKWSWDVLEVLVKSESTRAAHQLLNELVGECLPEGTHVHVSTHPVGRIKFPCVLIHPFVGVRGQTDAVLSGTRRTNAFLRDAEVPQKVAETLRIVTVTSTGASTRSQYVARQNDKLLSPGPWGVSPLRLILLEANQLTFPRAGRWIVENDSFFVLSRALHFSGDNLCLLTSKRRTTGSNSPWRVCVESTHERNGQIFAKTFREISSHEAMTTLLRPTSAIFLPNNLAQSLAEIGEDYSTRSSPLLIDFVLPRFMQRKEWIELCHSQGFGINSDLAWSNAKRIAGLIPQVELADGGDGTAFRHFGTDSEYTTLANGIRDDPLLTGLAYLPSTSRWLRHYHRQRGMLKTLT